MITNKYHNLLCFQVVSDMQYSPMMVFHLMLNTATLELELNTIYKRLFEEKVIIIRTRTLIYMASTLQ